jgi:hypothetical protein
MDAVAEPTAFPRPACRTIKLTSNRRPQAGGLLPPKDLR